MTQSSGYYLVLDVGTTTVRAMAFDKQLSVLGKSSRKLKKRFPKRYWVEQNPQEIVTLAKAVLKECVTELKLSPRRCLGVGITNQRETTILWDKATGKPVYPAIVWEDKRTAPWCRKLAEEHQQRVRQLTGLSIDPYFSATKITWILAHVPKARLALEQGRLLFGTVDTWLIWNLCEGQPHLSDISNAHRTLLVSAKSLTWDDELLSVFKVPRGILPQIRESRSTFGQLHPEIIGARAKLGAVCGDQQSSLYASWRFSGKKDATKITYGTGTFIDQADGSRHRVHDPFYTIVVPNPEGGHAFGHEGKIAKGAREVDRLLGDDRKLRAFLRGLAKDADKMIRRLPKKPKELIIDGGVSRDGIVTEMQASVSGIDTVALPIFDGTALGTAYLLADGNDD